VILRNLIGAGSLLVVGALLSACQKPTGGADDPQRQAMLDLLMPKRIEIVEPFTRVRSFDEDLEPDGIEVLIRAVNALDNPGLMIAGTMRIELYEQMPGSADRKGRLLEHWDVDLTTPESQKRFFNQLTQMYELRLGVDVGIVPSGGKFLLLVTYNTPMGEHLSDECVLHYAGTKLETRETRATQR